jgi:hypothetical protein
MDEGVGLEEGQCVVGCGCGCGFEEDNDGARLIDEFREWEEKWAPVAEDTIYSALSRDGSEMGDVGKWTEDVAKESREKKGEKTRVNENAKENERERMRWKGKAKGKGKGKIAEMVLDAERDMY